jgi:hypothetical protein
LPAAGTPTEGGGTANAPFLRADPAKNIIRIAAVTRAVAAPFVLANLRVSVISGLAVRSIRASAEIIVTLLGVQENSGHRGRALT